MYFKASIKTIAAIKKQYRKAFSLNPKQLNFSANNGIFAFKRKALNNVKTIKNQ